MSDLVMRLVKYFLEGLAVAIAAYVLPGKTLKVSEVGMIALVATATFAILDIYAPSVGASARTGRRWPGWFPQRGTQDVEEFTLLRIVEARIPVMSAAYAF
jgi:hypothetical protein